MLVMELYPYGVESSSLVLFMEDPVQRRVLVLGEFSVCEDHNPPERLKVALDASNALRTLRAGGPTSPWLAYLSKKEAEGWKIVSSFEQIDELFQNMCTSEAYAMRGNDAQQEQRAA